MASPARPATREEEFSFDRASVSSSSSFFPHLLSLSPPRFFSHPLDVTPSRVSRRATPACVAPLKRTYPAMSTKSTAAGNVSWYASALAIGFDAMRDKTKVGTNAACAHIHRNSSEESEVELVRFRGGEVFRTGRDSADGFASCFAS